MAEFTPERGSTPTASTAAEPDPLASARDAFYYGPRGQQRPTGEPPWTHGSARMLLDAEYGPRPLLMAASGTPPRPNREDVVVASLRRACRLDVPLTPEALLSHAHDHPTVSSVLGEMWPDTVRHFGTAHAEETLARLLHEAPDTTRTAFLLDCATSTGLRPLPAAEAARRAATPDRTVRHAAWRYLHLLPDGPPHLPAAGTAEDAYERLLLDSPDPEPQDCGSPHGITVAQTMLHGDLDTPGQGASGGMAVLLAALGDQLAAHDGIDRVLTVVTADHDASHATPASSSSAPRTTGCSDCPSTPPPLLTRTTGATTGPHSPGGPNASSPPCLRSRTSSTSGTRTKRPSRWPTQRPGPEPACSSPPPPDPHRTLVRKHTRAHPGDTAAEKTLRDDLHRVFCADRLVARADTVIAIPGRTGPDDLLRYFPVLRTRYGPQGPPAPPEGIAPYTPTPHEEALRRRLLDRLFAGDSHAATLSPDDRTLPLLLCVGRLHPVKQQDLLVHTWLTTELWRTTTLVVIGGTPHDPSPHEQRMRSTIDTLLRARDPLAARRLALMPAMPNDTVRRLEHALADPVHGTPAWYVCPSAKEEFGLAILEAMEAGLPAAGPRRGGVAHYLRHEENGILLDTSTAAGLASGLRKIASVPPEQRRHWGRAARETVTTRYAIADMARDLTKIYQSTTEPRPEHHTSSNSA
ncbi:glycosyltransferase [Streptomyces sp. NPDC097619]|uniref:glycosyltransferase family 4 protein n=1 Tax=Streptomyces sp. NPDC097619 TaxID=3157228 RepID=UPI0033228BC2